LAASKERTARAIWRGVVTMGTAHVAGTMAPVRKVREAGLVMVVARPAEEGAGGGLGFRGRRGPAAAGCG
jgi:hypothetical protein